MGVDETSFCDFHPAGAVFVRLVPDLLQELNVGGLVLSLECGGNLLFGRV